MGKNEIVKKSSNTEMFSVEDKKMVEMSKDASNYKIDFNQEDIAFPRLKLLQSVTDEANSASDKYIKGAEAGDILNTVTLELTKGDEGVLFVIVKSSTEYLEWTPKFEFVANHGSSSSILKGIEPEKGKYINEAGNTISKTYTYIGFVVNLEKKTYEMVSLPMSNSKLKVARKLNTLLTTKNIPFFGGVYKIKAVGETYNSKSYFNYSVEYKGLTRGIPSIGEEIYNKSKELFDSFKNGEIESTVSYKEDAAKDENTEGKI